MTNEKPLSEEQTQRIVGIAMDLAREGKTGELAEFLDHGLPVDALDPDRNTLLMLASYHGQEETLDMLLARGANPDIRNVRDQSPIAGALFKGEDAVVAKLLAAGADVDAGTPSARDAAKMFGREHLLEK
ncbi:ankyrin repeat domain-containing protein [Arthrobacter sp. NPDC089319]|uniref:ankyrin repeat domain-containing protein n=1 Tax=Arthrobacter sp. NPDC089319 TaxID=3155915 RepID=UPI00343BEFB1